MGNKSFCKCFSGDFSLFSSDPNKSSLNPGNSEILELVKNKKLEELAPAPKPQPTAPSIGLKDFKVEKVMKKQQQNRP